MNIVVNKNEIQYPANTLYSVTDGVNLLSGNYTPVQQFTYKDTLPEGSCDYTITKNYKRSEGIMVHIYGTSNYATRRSTITRDITDQTACYQIQNSGPSIDKGGIIPVNPYSPVTTVDLTLLDTYHTSAYNTLILYITSCDNNLNKVNNPCDIDITVEYYCL